jgi:hypothetical protein
VSTWQRVPVLYAAVKSKPLVSLLGKGLNRVYRKLYEAVKSKITLHFCYYVERNSVVSTVICSIGPLILGCTSRGVGGWAVPQMPETSTAFTTIVS